MKTPTLLLCLTLPLSGCSLLSGLRASSCGDDFADPGDACFTSQRDVAVALPETRRAAFANLDGDGALDVVLFESQSGDVLIIPNNNGVLQQSLPPLTQGAGVALRSAAAGDFDRNGREDLVFGMGTQLGIMLNQGPFPTSNDLLVFEGGAAFEVLPIDLDGDQDLDIVSTDLNGNRLELWFNLGDGTMQISSQQIGVGQRPIRLQAARILGGPTPDILVLNQDSSNLDLVHLRGLTGNQTPEGLPELDIEVRPPLGLPPGTGSVVAVDLDNDGDLDLAAASQGQSGVALFIHEGNGDFIEEDLLDAENGSLREIVAFDVDRDGFQDLVVTAEGELLFFLSFEGDGFDLTRATIEGAEGLEGLAAGDLDRDGRGDLIVVGRGNGAVTALLGAD